MSEYQLYEFVAIEQPLTAKQMAELRTVSTRAEITRTRFRNEYHWGNFKGDAANLVERYFDAHLYFADWGTRRLILRIPGKYVATDVLRTYFIGDAVRSSSTRKHVIVDLGSDEEGPNGDDEVGDGALTSLIPLRTELIRGDLRVAYLAWLLALQAGEVDEAASEPPLPPGLGALTAAQEALVEFLRLDRDLLTAAAAASPALVIDRVAAQRWVSTLPASVKNKWLQRAIEDPDLALGTELLRSFQQQAKAPPRPPARSAAELLASAAEVRARRVSATVRRPRARRP